MVGAMALTFAGCGVKADMAASDSVSKAEAVVQENITAGKEKEGEALHRKEIKQRDR